jgi:hypothetical protein
VREAGSLERNRRYGDVVDRYWQANISLGLRPSILVFSGWNATIVILIYHLLGMLQSMEQ